MTATTRPSRTGPRAARPGTRPAPTTVPGLRVLPDGRPPAVSWARPTPVPTSQDPLVLTPDARPPDGSGAETHHNRSPWFADPPDGLPDPRRFAASLTQALAEVLVGRRPPGQLVRWVAEDALATVNWRLRTTVAPRTSRDVAAAPPVLHSLRVQLPTRRAVEVAAHLSGDGVPPAIALRLEARAERWICTTLELGPATAG